jgi:hypothetical protein
VAKRKIGKEIIRGLKEIKAGKRGEFKRRVRSREKMIPWS